jgi:hypothetical protein
MKTLAYALFLSVTLYASNTKAATIHDIVGNSGFIGPIDYYTDDNGGSFSFSSGQVHWHFTLANTDTIDQDHIIGFLVATKVSGNPSPSLLYIVPAREALADVASQLEIQEYHSDVALNLNQNPDETTEQFFDITVPDSISTLSSLTGTLLALIGFARKNHSDGGASRWGEAPAEP